MPHRHLRVTAESLVSASGRDRAGIDSPSVADTAGRLRARETPEVRAAVEFQVESPLAPAGRQLRPLCGRRPCRPTGRSSKAWAR